MRRILVLLFVLALAVPASPAFAAYEVVLPGSICMVSPTALGDDVQAVYLNGSLTLINTHADAQRTITVDCPMVREFDGRPFLSWPEELHLAATVRGKGRARAILNCRPFGQANVSLTDNAVEVRPGQATASHAIEGEQRLSCTIDTGRPMAAVSVSVNVTIDPRSNASVDALKLRWH